MTKLISILTAASILVLANACDSSDDSSGSSSGTNTSGGTTSGGTTSGGTTSGGTTSGGTNGSIKSCPPANSDPSTCPQSEIDAYASCATTNCDAEYKECYGAGYASGNFAGPCGPQISCANKCECNDTACYQKCVPDSACTTCLQKMSQCVTSKCKLPCQGDTKTCADLETCCGKITDATKKSQCEAQLGAVKATGDVACNAVYAGFANDCK